jgi:uncharacterized protein
VQIDAADPTPGYDSVNAGEQEEPGVTFDPNANLDTGQIRDYRGRAVKGGLAAGGGALTLIVVIVYALLSGAPPSASDLNDLTNVVAGNGAANGAPSGAESTLLDSCKTGADANSRQDCRIVGYVNSIQSFWDGEFKAEGRKYTPAQTVFYSGTASTGCGAASSEVGPFYCPGDKLIWIDLGFLNDLHTKFGANGGPTAQAYVMAHEYGHHAQDLYGVLDTSSVDQGANGMSVRTELQADCYAGVWANKAASTGYLQKLTESDIADALDAAASVGDDRIQSEYQGRVNPESWTHGSSAQRQHWFRVGYESGNLGGCDTFSGSI